MAAAEPAAFSGIKLFPGTGGDDGAKGAAAFFGRSRFFCPKGTAGRGFGRQIF